MGFRMRVLFVPASAPSHYFPMVPLIWACRTAGHEVCVAAQPWGGSVVPGSGVPMVTIAESFDMTAELARHRPRVPAATPAAPAGPLHAAMIDAQIRFAAEAARDLVALARDWRPGLVVADPLVLAAAPAAAAAGAPLVHHLWGPDMLRAHEYGYPGCGIPLSAWPEALRGLYARHGCEPRVENAVATVDPWLGAMGIAETPSRIPIRFVPYNGSGVLPRPLLAPPRGRRVLVTWGSLLAIREGMAAFPVAEVVGALRAHGAEVVVAVTGADRRWTRDLPPEVTVVENVPLNAIMPSCDAAVHHGGGGTIMTAAYHGVPQLTLTATLDTRTCCERLAATGAGVSLDLLDLTPDALSDAVGEVLTGDRTRKAAAELRTEVLAQPAPADVAARVTALA
ncbi:nucleotide disphospho-sugar-binding domain-containing protein [Actinomadura sp. NEAU-AAG7]|uniref:nucleotide disphospho-sugar-binding domain-containing protein n=1 Tax=Actinomadura sp. NEAU-AAG7 TaxID=2839640 RepID=UPI001BE47DCD|nr:nucleotide disphospho-sugar-binding domain-containing protein [Actinomadura sp. NEAU-AAG7]MBT2211284.1 DUF1205 domain-containing protein [Actinomadura sp. NEAU-AAG7]